MWLALPLIVFAAAMQGKMLLNQRIFHYGFTLAMPGMLLLVVALTGWIPQALTKRGAFGAGFRVAACMILGVIVIVHLKIVQNSFAAKTKIVGMGADTIRADARGGPVKEALAEIERSVGGDKTLAVMPDAAMINFLSRRRNPTPYSGVIPAFRDAQETALGEPKDARFGVAGPQKIGPAIRPAVEVPPTSSFWKTSASTRKRPRTTRSSPSSSPRSPMFTSTTPSAPRTAPTPRPMASPNT